MRDSFQKTGYQRLNPNYQIIFNHLHFLRKMFARMHGYVAAYVLPEGYETTCPGVEYATNNEAEYAVITVTDPHVRSFERISGGYQRIMEYLQAGSFKERFPENIIPCFEYEYDKDGVHYMDIFIHTDSVIRGKS